MLCEKGRRFAARMRTAVVENDVQLAVPLLRIPVHEFLEETDERLAIILLFVQFSNAPADHVPATGMESSQQCRGALPLVLEFHALTMAAADGNLGSFAS